MQFIIEAPYHQAAVNNLQMQIITPNQLQAFVEYLANANMQVLLDYLGKHVRTGETIGSIRMRLIESGGDRVTVGVGSYGRGFQLRVLDRGRREIFPINKKFLRWIAWPSGAIVFARHARATQGSGIMKTAANVAISKIPEAIQKTITATPQGVV
ncbi:MAG: hypothetical protein WC365_09525 [Candidatus Babeliales bacterium]|jgi:hypothetical protein